MKKIGIVICNYNKEEEVLECIQCILESRFKDFDLYVVDNGSTDRSVQQIRERYPNEVTLLVNKENLGGSGGFNTGLRAAYEKGYPYVMCVDNDAMLDENAVGNLYEFLEEHREVGMAGAKVYHLENPQYVQQFGQKIDFDNFCTEVHYYNALEDGTMPDYLYVDCVAACSLMVRRSIIDKIGFMPEENFCTGMIQNGAIGVILLVIKWHLSEMRKPFMPWGQRMRRLTHFQRITHGETGLYFLQNIPLRKNWGRWQRHFLG